MLSGLNHVKTRVFHIYSLLMKYDNFFDLLYVDHTYEHINSIFSTYNVDSVDKKCWYFLFYVRIYLIDKYFYGFIH